MLFRRPLFWALHLIAALLVLSFFHPATRAALDLADRSFFLWLNPLLKHSEALRWICAFFTHRISDWAGDAVIFACFLAYVRRADPSLRHERIGQVLLCTLYIAAITVLINCFLFRKGFCIERLSPSIVLEPCVRLSQEISAFHIKDSSGRSFPGDHATSALAFAVSLTHFAGRRFGIVCALYALAIALPRLIVGAHWLSDVLIGSIPINLLCYAWIFCTPVAQKGQERLCRFAFSFKMRWMALRGR